MRLLKEMAFNKGSLLAHGKGGIMQVVGFFFFFFFNICISGYSAFSALQLDVFKGLLNSLNVYSINVFKVAILIYFLKKI